MVDEALQRQIDITTREKVGETGTATRQGRARAMAQRQRELQNEEGGAAVMKRAQQERGVSRGKRAEFTIKLDAADRPRAETAINRANALLQGGYDRMTDAQQDALRGRLKTGLDSSNLGELFRGFTADADVRRVTEDFLRDPEFLLAYQEQLNQITESKPNFSNKKVNERATLMSADDPATYPTAADAVDAAKKAILGEWRANQLDNLANLPGLAAEAYATKNIERAQAASEDASDVLVQNVIEERQREWNRFDINGKERVRTDFDTFMQQGGRGVLGVDAWERMSQEQRDEFNKRYGEKIFTQRLLAGKLAKDDVRVLATAEWLGESFPDRVDKIQEMFEANNEIKRVIAQGQLDGNVDKDLWDKIKAAGPAALGGALIALLATVFTPPLAVAGYAAMAAAGGVGLGGITMGINEMRNAA